MLTEIPSKCHVVVKDSNGNIIREYDQQSTETVHEEDEKSVEYVVGRKAKNIVPSDCEEEGE